jgi:hypothetical protein
MPSPWLTPDQAAQHVGRSRDALRMLRQRGGGPAYSRVRGRVRYRVADLDSWLDSGRVETADTAPRPGARRRTRAA